jgi:hypothetical protein
MSRCNQVLLRTYCCGEVWPAERLCSSICMLRLLVISAASAQTGLPVLRAADVDPGRVLADVTTSCRDMGIMHTTIQVCYEAGLASRLAGTAWRLQLHFCMSTALPIAHDDASGCNILLVMHMQICDEGHGHGCQTRLPPSLAD